MPPQRLLDFDPRTPLAEAMIKDALATFERGRNFSDLYDSPGYLEDVAQRAGRDPGETPVADKDGRDITRYVGVVFDGIQRVTSRRGDPKRKISLLRHAVDVKLEEIAQKEAKILISTLDM